MTRHSEAKRTVYFIKPVGMRGPVKIGCSYSPDKRRASLETWSPFPLEIVAQIAGSMNDERRFHALFWDDCQSHEWFKWSPKLQNTIDDIAEGRFDLASLPDPRRLPSKRLKAGNGWTPETRLRMSYITRIRHTENKFRRFLPADLKGWRSFLGDPDKMAPLDAFLADPNNHGLSLLEHSRAQLEYLKDFMHHDWAVRRAAAIEAEIEKERLAA